MSCSIYAFLMNCHCCEITSQNFIHMYTFASILHKIKKIMFRSLVSRLSKDSSQKLFLIIIFPQKYEHSTSYINMWNILQGI